MRVVREDYMDAGAELSPCGLYRFSLTRRWAPKGSTPMGDTVLWVMLNPSTADGLKDDPTIRRCVAFSRGWGFAALEVQNLYAWRATNPAELTRVHFPVEPPDMVGVDERLRTAARAAGLVIAAWGANAQPYRAERVRHVLAQEGEVRHLGLTKDGHPKHPLYLRGDTVPALWQTETHP